MKIRKIAYGMLAFSLILIISGCFSSFLNGLKKDHEIVMERMNDVDAAFESFSTKVSLFGDYREDFHESIFENLYYETLFTTDQFVKTEITKYEKMVDDITDDASTLAKLCDDIYYPDGTINSMCMNYKTMYEQVINYFVGDVEDYNEVVKKYNAYQNSISSTSFVKEYSTTKNYIDYNNDKTFDGKE